jgi:hypothetical protein
MSTTAITFGHLNKVERASILNVDEDLIKNIKYLIDYRKKIAIEILQCKPENGNINDLNHVYNFINDQIKLHLSI